MKFRLIILCLLAIHVDLYAQQPDVVKTATGFITQQKFDEGLAYVDSVIKADKRNVDALMMKGNVILNRDLWNQPDPEVYTDNDESIYSFAMEATAEQRKIVSPKTEGEVETLWLQCLKMDSARLDIRKGLAMLYAMALDKERLKKQIADIKRVEPDNGEQAFNLCEFARKVKERGRFDDAMDIYVYISQLYPTVAGVRCDMASEYYYQGRINEALTWLDSTFNFKTVDETSFLNGAYIYSELGYFDDAQDVFNTYSRVYDRKMNTFYYGLRQFADSSDNYYNTLKYFTDVVDTNAYYNEYEFAKYLMTFRDSFTLANYHAAINTGAPEAYKALIHTRAVRQFADCEPYIRFGVQQNKARNFAAAVQLLEEGEHCQLDDEKREFWRLGYGYALYKMGEYEKCVEVFKHLRGSKDMFKVNAAIYFSGIALQKLNSMHEARANFQSLVDARQNNKYNTLARYRLNKIK